MIRTERLVQSFLELTAIDNPTLYERELSECLRRRFAALGIVLAEDGAGAAIGGNAGNLYAYLPGDETLAPILLSAHMDAVAPACAKKPVLHPDGRITSDGTTVLGADDVSGLCAILEAVTSVLEMVHRTGPLNSCLTLRRKAIAPVSRSLIFLVCAQRLLMSSTSAVRSETRPTRPPVLCPSVRNLPDALPMLHFLPRKDCMQSRRRPKPSRASTAAGLAI